MDDDTDYEASMQALLEIEAEESGRPTSRRLLGTGWPADADALCPSCPASLPASVFTPDPDAAPAKRPRSPSSSCDAACSSSAAKRARRAGGGAGTDLGVLRATSSVTGQSVAIRLREPGAAVLEPPERTSARPEGPSAPAAQHAMLCQRGGRGRGGDEGDSEGDSDAEGAASRARMAAEGRLWADKYRPTSYVHLISDERVNRDILQWLRMWDHQGAASPDVKARAILLWGPPGYGKTTLAHVLAKTAGFNPVEINASAVRSLESFEKAVMDAVGFRNVMSDAPNLLVIDEVDGIAGSEGKGAVDLLVRLISFRKQARRRNDNGDEAAGDDGGEPGGEAESSAGARKGRKPRRAKDGLSELRRPIICTCNDLYAPALRQLRAHAKVFKVDRPSPQILLERLKRIAEREGVSVEQSALASLCELTRHDVRSCLNTLQFAASLGRPLTSKVLRECNVGLKDSGHNVFDVWRSVFGVHCKSVPSDFEGMYNLVDGEGSCDKLVEGCWANYATCGAADHLMKKSVACIEWLAQADCLQGRCGRRAHSEGSVSLLPAAPIMFRTQWGDSSSDNITFPRVHSEMWAKEKESQNICRTLMAGIDPHARGFASTRAVTVESLSPLLDIVSPHLRPLSQQLMSPGEKALLGSVVGVMHSLGLTFRAEAASGAGPSELQLDPPLHRLVEYEGAKPSQRRPLAAVHKRLVAHDIQAEHWRRLAAAQQSLASEHRPMATPSAPPSARKPKDEKKAEPQPAVVAKDFFGRPIVRQQAAATASSPAKGSSAGPRTSPARAVAPVRYKFHEGHTNAVRRKIYVKDLM
eukprot:m51a1_g6366 hypothetical protein (813) ;mRNA; f:116492-119425